MSYIRPHYSYVNEHNCYCIKYGNKEYLFDIPDFMDILNNERGFLFRCDLDDYPSFMYNGRAIYFYDFLYKDNNLKNYYFKNGNKFDLRRSNVEIRHPMCNFVCNEKDVIEYIPGHFPTYKENYLMKNPLWRIMDKGKERLLMYCEVDTFCLLCPESYQKILDFEKNECGGKKLTFSKMTNGYISAHLSANKALFIHQIITGCHGNGKGTKNISVDHVDRDPLNNTMENLRIATREEQEQNSKGIAPNTKRARQSNARPLPEGITQDMMRKYVIYYKSTYNKEKGLTREYFTVEQHPLLKVKRWESSKSNKVSIMDKLAQANQTVDNLDKGILPTKKDTITKQAFTNNIDICVETEN